MNHFKKFLALSLSALMVVGGSLSVSAKRFDDVANDNAYAEQIDLLSEIGVILGTAENEFSPNEAVTREQMALLLYRMMLGDNNAGNVNTSPFTDLYDPTYHGAISWAAANEYIIGTGGTTFEPTGGILLQDGITMLVRLLGHETDRMNKGYPWTYIDAGVKLGLTAGLDNLSYTDTMTRGQVAALLYNALTADYLIPKTVAGYVYYETSTIIEEVFGYSIEEAVLTATNDYALPGFDKVIKKDYVALTYTEHVGDNAVERTIYVNYKELGFAANANEKLGDRVKAIFTVDPKSKLVTVLGALELGRSETVENATVPSNKSYVEIKGVRYNVVSKYSDILGTNNNELLVYKYNFDGTMTQVTSNSALSGLLGFYTLEMIYDNNSNIASRALIKPFTMAQLKVDRNGGINIAGGLSEKQLSGGLSNPNGAKNGDYVLYFYNSALKALEIKQPLEIIQNGLVTRLTTSEATVDGAAYKLGKAGTPISASSIASQLTVGRRSNVIIYQNCIVGVTDALEHVNSSNYLVSTSATTPVYADGGLRYFMTANIGGVNTGIFTLKPNSEVGQVYRYLVDGNGFYTLIPMTIDEATGSMTSGTGAFIQNGNGLNELGLHIATTDGATILRGENFFYTLDAGKSSVSTSAGVSAPMSFLTNDDTIIMVGTKAGIVAKSGTYSSTITINDGATVTAVFADRPGSIEMLRFLYISDGELGSVNEGASYAKVFSVVGLEYIDGNVMTSYRVYNFASGKMETVASPYGALTVGTTYAIDANGHLSNMERSNASGIVTGYADGIVTIGGEVYRLAEDVQIHAIAANLSISSLDIEDVYMHNVEIFAEGREIKTILAGPALGFSAKAEGNTITLTANLDMSQLGNAESLNVKLNNVLHNGAPLANSNFKLSVEGNNIVIDSLTNLEAGMYVVSIGLFDQTYIVNCTIA